MQEEHAARVGLHQEQYASIFCIKTSSICCDHGGKALLNVVVGHSETPVAAGASPSALLHLLHGEQTTDVELSQCHDR